MTPGADPTPVDVPSPIDLQAEADARAWADAANRVRPWRLDFFAAISAALPAVAPLRVLELGAGPGFLAERVLRDHPAARLVLLDHSAAMQSMAAQRLQPLLASTAPEPRPPRVIHLCRSFKDDGWAAGLGPFDAVVTHQAVHELRHRRHAPALHAAVRSVLAPGGVYLVSDHHLGDGGMANADLYMTVDEQRQAMQAAGFGQVDELLRRQGLVLHRARG